MKRLGIWSQLILLIGGVMVTWFGSPVVTAAKIFPEKAGTLAAYEAVLSNYFELEELPSVLSLLAIVDSADKISNLSPMQGGYSTRVFSLSTINKRRLVLRVLPKRDSSQDFSKEIYASKENAKRNTAPQILYADSNNGILVMDYLEGKVLRDSIYENTGEKINELAHLLKRSHSIPATHLVRYDIYERIYNTVRGMHAKLPARLSKLVAAVREIEKEPLLGPEVPCHNDLNPNNILESQGRLWLIDWEMAGLNDPFYDLATIANFMVLNPKLQKKFLKVYLGKDPSDQQQKRFAQMRLVSLTFYGTILQKIAQEPIFYKFDQLGKELAPMEDLFARRQVWTQFNNKKALSLFGLSMLAEAEKIARSLVLL